MWDNRVIKCRNCGDWYFPDGGFMCGVIHRKGDCCHYMNRKATDEEIEQERALRRKELDIGAVC